MDTPEQLAQVRAAQAQAEADAQARQDYYSTHAGVPAVAAGASNEPLVVPLGPVSGVHGRARAS
jgi:hypothetical protein